MITELENADNKNIMVVREKLHHYRWLASKLLPIYGDKQQIVQDTKIEISWQKPEKVIDSHEDAETLAQEIAQMQDSGGVKDR